MKNYNILFTLLLFISFLFWFKSDAKDYQKEVGKHYAKVFCYNTKDFKQATTNGEVVINYLPTCSHPNLPMNTVIKFTNSKNGRIAYARVNDKKTPSKNFKVDLIYISTIVSNHLRLDCKPTVVEWEIYENTYKIKKHER